MLWNVINILLLFKDNQGQTIYVLVIIKYSNLFNFFNHFFVYIYKLKHFFYLMLQNYHPNKQDNPFQHLQFYVVLICFVEVFHSTFF